MAAGIVLALVHIEQSVIFAALRDVTAEIEDSRIVRAAAARCGPRLQRGQRELALAVLLQRRSLGDSAALGAQPGLPAWRGSSTPAAGPYRPAAAAPPAASVPAIALVRCAGGKRHHRPGDGIEQRAAERVFAELGFGRKIVHNYAPPSQTQTVRPSTVSGLKPSRASHCVARGCFVSAVATTRRCRAALASAIAISPALWNATLNRCAPGGMNERRHRAVRYEGQSTDAKHLAIAFRRKGAHPVRQRLLNHRVEVGTRGGTQYQPAHGVRVFRRW
jgi:hypothetical protein